MNLSISNIAWGAERDEAMYATLRQLGFNGLEIAPTRIFPDAPYDHLAEARDFAARLRGEFGLAIPSMQSIWYGRQERVFGSSEERQALIDYTRKACRFAEAVGCRNLVFGNPRNRDTDDPRRDMATAVGFFRTLGDAALDCGTVIAIEPNPTIYNTRFINTTPEAAELVSLIDHPAVKINYDLGTVIHNGEDPAALADVAPLVNHIHISEPYLKPIADRPGLHSALVAAARKHCPDRYLSIEMGRPEDPSDLQAAIEYFLRITSRPS